MRSGPLALAGWVAVMALVWPAGTHAQATGPAANGTFFAGVFTDNAVLQRGATSRAAVFGVVQGGVSAKTTTVSVTVQEAGQPRYTLTAAVASAGADNVTWKALLKPHASYGGNVTLSAQCGGCRNTTAVSLHGLTFGDVFFCSGQSNMELPLAHALTRNRTFSAVDEGGQYGNIRTFYHDHDGGARWDGDELWVLPPPPPPPPGGPFFGWQRPNSSVLQGFSAACWFFAQELTDMAIVANDTVPVFGMVQSAWGGSEIDVWIQNASIAACKNASGAPEPNRQGPVRHGNGNVYPNNGALFNGMTAPWINMTIFGALWYQVGGSRHIASPPSPPQLCGPVCHRVCMVPL